MPKIHKITTAVKAAVLITISTTFFGVNAFANDEYSDGLLKVKKLFSINELKALAQPYEGVVTGNGKQRGLFAVEASGISTKPIVEAAQAFLDRLSTPQKIRTQFAIDDREWRRWSNVDNAIYMRNGVSLKELDAGGRAAARAILNTSLSVKGLALSQAIMKTDQTLREINGGSEFLDEELYFFTIMGVPSETEPWGWQLDGHHIVINYFVMGDQVVMTPTFLGAEPAVTTTGKYAGNEVLQEEQNAGLAFMQSLSPAQQMAATLDARKTKDDMRAGANADNLVLDFAGLKASNMTAAQRNQLLRLTGLFVNNMKEGHAKIRMDQVAAHMDETYFSWVGTAADDAVFYYRIHSPVILIEFDHQIPIGTTSVNLGKTPIRDHIHVIIRTPNGNDYGKDLLGQHLRAHAH